MMSTGFERHGHDRLLTQLFPDAVMKTWNMWEYQGLVIISLTFKLIFILANRRKFYPESLYRFPLWCAYSLKTSVVTTALGMIVQTALDGCNTSKRNELLLFWASLIFIHLCGSETFKAYSLEDNELWLRNSGSWMVISVAHLYILFLSWPGCSHLPLLGIIVTVACFIKSYGHIHAQRLGSIEHLRESLSCPAESPPAVDHHKGSCKTAVEGHNLFQASKPIFVDLPFEDTDNFISYFNDKHSPDEAFCVVEAALGYAYDIFFTNISELWTIKGFLIHLSDFLLLFSVQVAFVFLIDMDDYQATDNSITFLLFAEILVTKIYVFVTMLQSDWMDLWLSQHKLTRDILIFSFLKQPSKRRWSNSIAQIDLLSVSLLQMPGRFSRIRNYFGIDKYLEKHRYKTYSEVPGDLKNLICKEFQEFIYKFSDPKALCNHKGSFFLNKAAGCSTLLWSINEVEFDQSILMWHIAITIICYLEIEDDDQVKIHSMTSKNIFKYLVSLLVSKPELMPKGIGMKRYRDTCAHANHIFKKEGHSTLDAKACQKLLTLYSTEELNSRLTLDPCKSTLLYGCLLTLDLQKIEKKHMWKVINQVSIEMLAYAAAQCTGFQHTQQLRRGGEFLTHVWLLMAGFGMIKQS